MAYLTHVAAVRQLHVREIQQNAAFVLTPTLILGVSHLIAYWIRVEPLGQTLRQVIDGGDRLNVSFWHPLRPPKVHGPEAVRRLTERLTAEWNEVCPDSIDHHEWLTAEMTRLLTVMKHSAETGACLVTVLEHPADPERAQRVRIPWMPASPQHGAPPFKWWKLW